MIAFIKPILNLILVLILLPLFTEAQDRTSWPLFRGDSELRGVSYADIPASPVLLWSFKTADGIKSSPVVAEGKIVFGAVNGTVYALDLKGKLLWQFETGNSIEGPALIHNRMVYVGNLDGTLLALNLDNGKEIWRYKTDGQIMGSPNIYRKGSSASIIVGSYDYFLHCVDAKTGAFRWKYESDNFIHGAAAISGDMAIFGGCDGYLHLVDMNTGKAGSKVDVATYIASSATAGNGFAYIGDYDGQFTCINLNEQKIAWSCAGEDSQLLFIASPALFKEHLIAGGRDRFIYCFNKNNGNIVWKYNTGSRVDASPVIIGEKVLAVNMRGDVMILDMKNGKPLWTYELGTPVSGSPAVIQNHIIVGADDGRVYCFGVGK